MRTTMIVAMLRRDLKIATTTIGKRIREARVRACMTQEELGKLIGVQRAQISRLENNANNVTLDTLMRVFAALKAKVKFQVELPNINISVVK